MPKGAFRPVRWRASMQHPTGGLAVVRCQPSKEHRVVVVLMLAVIVLAGCSQSSKSQRTARVTVAPTTASSTTDASTSTTAPKPASPRPKLILAHKFTAAQRQVAQGYFAAVRAHLRASEHPTRHPSELALTYSGAMLNAARADIARLAQDHHAVRLPAKTKSLVRVDGVRINGLTAVVDVCTVDDAIVYEQPVGSIVDSDVVSHKRRATLRLTAGHWKLLFRSSKVKQEGVGACG